MFNDTQCGDPIKSAPPPIQFAKEIEGDAKRNAEMKRLYAPPPATLLECAKLRLQGQDTKGGMGFLHTKQHFERRVDEQSLENLKRRRTT